jgi:hypothetical protein
MTLDFAQFVGMRLNEHAFLTWDIEVVGDSGGDPHGSGCRARRQQP